jgi:NF-kappa-B inhibitor-like protein 2
VTKWELADMQARLYLNLGVTKEHVEEFDEAINYYETAIKICKSNDLFELQHQCLMAAGLNYSLKRHDNATALSIFNKALEVSKRIHDKNEKTCETLLSMSTVLTKNGDFQGAKQALKKAYKLKSPNQSDRAAIEKTLKVGEYGNFIVFDITSNNA